MKRLLLASACLLAVLAPARAAAPGDRVLKAMTDELDRTVRRLKMDSLDRPYYVSYYVVDSTETSLSASFGSLLDDSSDVSRRVAADVRVGSAAFDNTWYVGQDFNSYSPAGSQLSEEAGYDALRFGLWSLSDDAYKKALEKYSQKKAYRTKKNISEIYGDLSPEPRVRLFDDARPSEAFDAPAWRERVKALSAVFRKYPAVQDSQVSFGFAMRTARFADSGGTRFRRGWDDVTLSVRATVQDRTGLRISDSEDLLWPSLAAVPSDADLAARTEAFAREMSYLVDASTAEVYLGPVLFEGQAAAEFLNQLFVANVSFPRAPWADKDDWTRYYIASGELTKKLGMRVLPAFVGVTDDPLKNSYDGTALAGSYPVDNEGVRPAPLELVRGGKLVNFYMDRSPVKEFRASNGHARGSVAEFPTPRPGNVFFSFLPAKRAPEAELKKKLLELAAENGLDYAVLVRRVDPETSREYGELLSDPVIAYKVSVKDGSETPLGPSEWSGVTFRALRDITLASDKDQVYNYYQAGPFYYNRGLVPASIAAPEALLVQEMELKPTEAKPDRPPYLPHPYFAK